MAETLGKEMEVLNRREEEAGGATDKVDESTSSSSDSEAEDGEEIRVEALESALAENPANYDAHVQYIQCLRKLGDIEKLRQARSSMNELFPLSANMWAEWAKDEICLNEGSLNEGSEALSTVEEIYERGLHEYLSVSLWCDYLNFVQEHDPLVSQCSPAGVSKMRDLFERALTAAGLHITEGGKIWDAYREFEQAIYLTIDDNSTEEKAKQLNHIRSLFHRQLAVPLADLRSLLVSYKLWEGEQGGIHEDDSDKLSGVPANVALAYQKAIEMYDARVPHEDKLSNQDVCDADRLQYYMTYIKFEESFGDPARVQILYERAVSAFPISSDLWMGYTSYLDKTLKVASVVKNVYSRATRNCPWVGSLWVKYLLSLERVHASQQEISTVFERSFQCAFTSIDEYLDLFLTRIDGLRRMSLVAKEGVEFVLIRETFQRAVDYLSPQLTKVEDLLRLHAYWARLEATLGKDLVAARGVWENLIKRSGSMLEAWQGYIAMEIERGHVNEARSIYKRCYSKRFTGNGSEEICYSWLRFEREFGSLDDLDLAEKKVMPRLEELKQFRTQQESKNVASFTTPKDNSVAKKVPQKRKMSKVPPEIQSPEKRQRYESTKLGELSHENATEEISSVHDEGTGEKLNGSFSATTVDNEGQHRITLGDSTSKGNRQFYIDQCTAFVSNLSLEANEEHLRKFFNDGGGVTAIRLLRDKFSGKSRGLAYVDFSDEEHLLAAIAKNKQKLLGQKLSVVRSDPKQSKKRASSSGRGGRTASDSKNASISRNTESSGRASNESISHRRGGHVQLMGRNTFAMPRSVARPLGWSSKESKAEKDDEQPKSNDEFKKMLLK